ncbi:MULTISPECIES: signal peptidase II [Microbacterium]|uniref:signal peptidase II n=1 Tax=Microbacterium TaxID=33882 RepID=UPI0024AF0E9C|nr:signal peptidase II [Microbacterium barkeri]MDI6943540.1 signal peptidase II [Microbacterium barkeri]
MSGRPPLRAAAAGTTIAILAIVVLAADQFSKQLAIQSLDPGRTVPVVGDALQWHLVYNPGAAFSLGEGVTWVFTLAMALVASAIVWLAITRIRSRLWAVVLGLLLGGVLGNLVDRVFREPGFAVGHVVDFILTPWMWFWTTPAIYNVADIFIVSMMISVALLTLVGIRFDGSREKDRAVAEGAHPDDEGADAGRRA